MLIYSLEVIDMTAKFNEISKNALKDVAEFMCVAARTAPKTRGRDNLEIIVIDNEADRLKLIQKMKEYGEKNSRPSCIRDADNINDSAYIVVIGTKVEPLGLNCGYCGFKDCDALKKTSGVCAYNSIDLGIATDSAVDIADKFHVDNRVMYSIGKGAIAAGLLDKSSKIALGIPLSATGKNPFFDRK